MKAADLTREHRGKPAVIRMGKDRIAGPIWRFTHHEESVTVTIGGPSGWQMCCLDVDAPVEVTS